MNIMATAVAVPFGCVDVGLNLFSSLDGVTLVFESEDKLSTAVDASLTHSVFHTVTLSLFFLTLLLAVIFHHVLLQSIIVQDKVVFHFLLPFHFLPRDFFFLSSPSVYNLYYYFRRVRQIYRMIHYSKKSHDCRFVVLD